MTFKILLFGQKKFFFGGFMLSFAKKYSVKELKLVGDFLRSRLSSLPKKSVVGFVGSRRWPWGFVRSFAFAVGRLVARLKFFGVSGGALGVDSWCQQGFSSVYSTSSFIPFLVFRPFSYSVRDLFARSRLYCSCSDLVIVIISESAFNKQKGGSWYSLSFCLKQKIPVVCFVVSSSSVSVFVS